MLQRKVVVTGFGAVSPFGIGADQLIQGLVSGRSAVVSKRSEWEPLMPHLDCWVGAPLQEPLPSKEIPRKFRRTMGPTAIMALMATKEAVAAANLSNDLFPGGRVGVSFSSTMGSIKSLNQFYEAYYKTSSLHEIPAGIFFQTMSHTCAANIAHALNIKGRVLSPDAACASSTQAIGFGFEAIKYGCQDIMLCGGADELDVVVSNSFDLVNATSCRFNDSPEKTPRPFDKDRDGTVCGEGAGCLVLESEESALSRGAEILAEIAGFSTSTDGTHLAQPNQESIARCMREALTHSGVAAEMVNYVNAHATATVLGDIAESQAISEVFGNKIPVSSFKGHLGHTLGASGALELLACIRMMKDSIIIPTRNLENPGQGCEDINLVRHTIESQIDICVKNSFAFGGINAVLIVRKYESSNDRE